MRYSAFHGNRAFTVVRTVLLNCLIFFLLFGAMVRVACPARYLSKAMLYATSFSVPPALVLAVVWAESGFDPGAVSPKGALGLMQLMPATFHDAREALSLAPDASPMDPSVNLLCGVWYLSVLIEEFGRPEVALAAYNAGPARVRGWLSDPTVSPDGEHLSFIPYPETEKYLRRVLILEKLYQFVI